MSKCPDRKDITVDSFYNDDERRVVLDLALERNPKLVRFYTPGMKSPASMKYRHFRANKKLMSSLHHGQRKLFMSELQFLTGVLKSKDTPAVLVYAGAAPGVHIPFLASLFPKTEFYLYDPAKFIIPKKFQGRIHLFNQYFTPETANQWSGMCDLFISDIRRDDGKEDSQRFEKQVAVDMAEQEDWVRIIRPRLGALLKFRPPYIEPDVKQTNTYLAGKIMLQTWPAKKSTETRLVVPPAPLAGKRYATMKLSIHDYQDWMSYHNYGRRIWLHYPSLVNPKSVPGYDNCFDCTNEAQSWIDYTKKYKVKTPPAKLMNRLTASIRQSLISTKEGSTHGLYPNIPMCKRRGILLKQMTA